MATVMLDAGHGGYDSGAVNGDRYEKNDTLNLVLAVGTILENNGVDVLYTRTTDVYQSPNEKAGIANRSDADYFISIHRNSSPNPNTYSGVETLVYRNSGIPAVFAENINRELAQVGFANLGVEERPNLAVLRGTRMPAALVEVGFINTDQDNQLFDLKFPEIAQAIANGIIQTVQGAALVAEEAVDYRIELGMFRHRHNAEVLAENMQADGFDCYIEPRGIYFSVCHGSFPNKESAKEVEEKLFLAGYETRIICTGNECEISEQRE
ncbi:MAG: N-acetylmuramoyl-L-alanine amidase [Lachnospiraceae bacterium]|nr:N-acetylmuramoyl-L-alanine amidase [Lachnospiraceae bacterium]